MTRVSKWKVMCDFTGDIPMYDVFRHINYNKKTRKYMDIEIYSKSPILGYEDEMEAWRVAEKLNEVSDSAS